MSVRLRLTLAVIALGLAGTQPALGAPRAQLSDVEDEVMCPVCGTALNLSQAPQADRERELIRREIAAGKTKAQIKRDLVAEYGSGVLAEPSKSGFDLAAWLVPLVALVFAASAIALGLRRWRRESSSPERPPISGEDRARLESDLAKHDG